MTKSYATALPKFFIPLTFVVLVAGAIFCAKTSHAEEITTKESEVKKEQTDLSSFVGKKNTKALPFEVGKDVPSTESLFGQVLKGLLYCVAALFLGVSLYSKFGPNKQASQSPIKILARQQLSPKSSLFYIELDDQKFLIGSTADNLSLISEIGQKDTFNASLESFLEAEEQKEKVMRAHG